MDRQGYFGIGSNLGDRLANLRRAVRFLNDDKGIEVLNCSHIVETPAWGYSSANPFLNNVVHFSTSLADSAIDGLISACEAACGRTGTHARTATYKDREIDVDLLLLDDWEGQDSQLIVPHPEAHRRAFILQPLEELDPDIRLAGYTLDYWINKLDPDELDALRWRRDISIWPLD